MKINHRETRNTLGTVTQKGNTIRGYAAVFNRLSENLGDFREVIQPGAFDRVLLDDCKCLFNHDSNLILGRSKNGKGTLKLGIDQTGLWYQVELPDTQAGRDLKVSLERGDVDQSSFGFTIAVDRWSKGADGLPLRTVVRVSRLFDVSPVVSPAYPDTAVALVRMKQAGITRDSGNDLLTCPYEAKLRLIKLGPTPTLPVAPPTNRRNSLAEAEARLAALASRRQ
jgi:HK97 family phage prohead protease